MCRSRLATLESEGQVFQGRYRSKAGEIEWCNRRILARIHHLTLGRLRREIAPVTAAQFHQFLARWQHLAPGTQLHGADGAMQIVRQLQGFEIPASAWEGSVLSRADCRSTAGESGRSVSLGRSGVGAAFAASGAHGCRAACAPDAHRADFLFRARRCRLADRSGVRSGGDSGTCRMPRGKCSKRSRNAARRSSRIWCGKRSRLPSEVEDALWELTAGGLVTADGFENLRALIDPKRRRGEGRGQTRTAASCGGALGAGDPVEHVIAPDDRVRSGSRNSCCCAGACCSATCSRARRWRRRGAIYCRCCGGWKRRARSAADASWRGSPASSSRARRRSICCGRFEERRRKTGLWWMWRRPIR